MAGQPQSLAPVAFHWTGDGVPSAPWESGIQVLEPPRLGTLQVGLTRLDHPEWTWELRRRESNPRQISDCVIAPSEITLAELGALAAGFLRFLLPAIWERAKRFRARTPYPEAIAGRAGRQPHRREF